MLKARGRKNRQEKPSDCNAGPIFLKEGGWGRERWVKRASKQSTAPQYGVLN